MHSAPEANGWASMGRVVVKKRRQSHSEFQVKHVPLDSDVAVKSALLENRYYNLWE